MSLRLISSTCLCSCLLVALAVPTLLAQPPAQASSSSPTSSRQGRKPAPAASRLDPGSVSKGVYRNPSFGFTCKIPEGWVLRTEELNARDDEDPKTDGSKPAADAGKAERVLLAAFSRPPGARGENVNSSIVIAAESAAAYPGLKDAAQYFGPVTEVAKAQGFEIDEEPYEFALGTKKLVRGDFHMDVGTRVMRQSTLAMLARGYAISFTFLGGTEDEVEELIGTLAFTVSAKH